MSKQNKIIIGVTLILVLLVIFFSVIKISTDKKETKASTNIFEGEQSLEKLSEISSCPLTADKDIFAKCLTEKGMTFYGAEWCSHCKAQKELFGESLKYIKYVECPDNTQLCIDKGIQGYPTWILEKPQL